MRDEDIVNEQRDIEMIVPVKYLARAQMIVNALRVADVPFDTLTACILGQIGKELRDQIGKELK